MYFLLASIIALIGIGVLIKSVKTKAPRSDHYPHLIDTDAWIEAWEFSLQKFLRKILRVVVVHIVSWYRFLLYEMTLHKTVRQKVRELLYEHYHEQRKKKQIQHKTMVDTDQ